MQNAHEPLTLIGPKGLERVVNALRVIAPELPFELKFIEIQGAEETFEFHGYRLKAFKVNHNVLCYGYTLEIDRAGRFDAARAKAAGIPLKCWNPLQKGNTVEIDGVVYTPDMVLGPPRKGIKLTYATDTRPVRSIAENAAGSDLFICEGMYGEAGEGCQGSGTQAHDISGSGKTCKRCESGRNVADPLQPFSGTSGAVHG